MAIEGNLPPNTSDLSLLQRKVLFLLENLGPYEKIEIRRAENGVITVVTTSTTKEEFNDPILN